MRFLRPLIFSPLTFYSLCCAVILTLNLTPLITHIMHSPPGRSFALIHNNAQDFFFYQAIMNEGANGQWLTTDPYTTEPHQPSFIFSYFVWLGKLGHFLGMTPAVTYHVMRIFFSLCFMIASWLLIRFLKLPYLRLTTLFLFFAGAYMHTTAEGVVPFMNWWTGMDPVRRIAYLPHHMFGNFFLVITFFCLLKFIQTNTTKWIAIAFGIIPFLAFIHPPSTFILLVVLPATYALFVIRQIASSFMKKSKSNDLYIGLPKKTTFLLAAYLICSAILLLGLVSLTNQGFPWTQYISFEKRLQFPLDQELIGAFGLIFPLAVIGILSAWWSAKFEKILVACWFVTPFLLIPLAPALNISNIRLTQGAPYVPLAILAVWGVSVLSNQLSVLLHKINRSSITVHRYTNYLFPLLISVIFLIFSYPSINWSVRDQIREYWPIFGNVYLDDRLNKVFEYINLNYPKKHVLSTFYAGNYLPAYTYTVSYVGHFGYTNQYERKNQLIERFLKGQMSDEETKKFLETEKIDLIFQGPEEKSINPSLLYPSILETIYKTDEATLYIQK